MKQIFSNKNLTSLLVLVLMSLSLVLTSCGDNTSNNTNQCSEDPTRCDVRDNLN